MTAALNHDLRRGRITSSSAAAILGLDPRCSPLRAWERIMDPHDNEDPRMAAVFKRGHVLEDALLDWGATEIVEAGLAPAIIVEHPPTTVHPTEDWIADSTDALYRLTDGGLAAAEAKTVAGFASKGWGEHWSDEVPRYILVQGHWHNMVHDTDGCYFPSLVGFAMELRMYAIERDREVEQALLDTCGEWHHRYVVTGTPPPVTVAQDDEVLARLFPLGAGEIPDNPRVEALVRTHVSLQQTISPLKKERDLIGAQIQELLGTSELCRGEWGKASWKNSKDREETDWPAVIAELLAVAKELPGGEEFAKDMGRLIRKHTTTKAGGRRLLTSLTKDKE